MTQRTDNGDSRPIESRADLLSVFEGGEKPAADWRIGTEHEKFVYRCGDHRAPAYDEPGGIRDLLMGLTEFGWEPVMENGNVIALKGKDGNVSLEPAGQFELSGAALTNLTRPARKRRGTSPSARKSAIVSGSASSASACGRTRPARSCR